MGMSVLRYGVLPLALVLTANVVRAGPEDDRQLLEEVTVTGAVRVTAGGAQDIDFARAEIENGRIPYPDSMTAEGLLSQHDLLLPANAPCAQLFCITAETVRAGLATLPRAAFLVGLGFASNVEPDGWRRQPVNIVAVVDKSGSMNGQPLALVRRSLRRLVGAMHDGEQLSIVLYGDRSHVYVSPTRIDGTSRTGLLRAIDRIESSGSTNMEEGLKVGLEVAARTNAEFPGVTRLILFTDERPNVGRTDAESFGGMARKASLDGIGMTTIGVGVQFDTALATALGSVRGGNLFFLDSEEAADSIFDSELDYMVSELAHDVEITLRPARDYRIAGVYGVPGELMGWQDESSVVVKIPTVFLSQRAGGIFVSLAAADELQDLPLRPREEDARLMAATVSYLPARGTVPESSALSVGAPSTIPSAPMRLARVLVDEFLSLRAATTAHYARNDQETAYRILQGLDDRLGAIDDRALSRELDAERELVSALLDRMAFLSGHKGEGRGHYGSALWGDWEVVGLRGDDYLVDVGDVMSFGLNNEVRLLYPDSADSSGTAYQEYDTLDYWPTRRELVLPDEELTIRYAISGDKLTLRVRSNALMDATRIDLERANVGVVGGGL